MSVSHFTYDISSSVSVLSQLSESFQACSLPKQNPFLQDSVQVEKESSCATSVLSGLAASFATRNPVPFLMGLCGCLPRTFAQQKIESEFQVNTYTNNSQWGSSLTSLSNDNFVVTWGSDGQDGSLDGVFGQLFSVNGSKIGNEFQINTYTPGVSGISVSPSV